MKKAIEAQPTAEVVVFLGDGYADFEKCKPLLEDKRVYCVKGNNDFHCDYQKNAIIHEGGLKIYITHGHYEYVKSTLSNLVRISKRNNCQLVLYGHTHTQQEDNADGIKLFCPGALRSDEYGVIDIIENGFICIGIKLR
jgi:putative phosphoesterase